MINTIKLIKALADESRLRIIWMLEESPLCVCEIQEVLGLAQSSVSRHLQLLEDSGYIVSERRGNWKDYRINPSPPLLVQGLIAQVRTAALMDSEAERVRSLAKKSCREEICKVNVA